MERNVPFYEMFGIFDTFTMVMSTEVAQTEFA